MPELPEVETVRLTLAPLIGARVTSVWYSGKPLHGRRPVDVAAVRAAAAGARVEGVRRRGKFLLVDFARRSACVVIHLGMTGRLRLMSAASPEPVHTHLVWQLAGRPRRALRFSDPRRFGIVSVADRGREHDHPSLARLGLDPLTDELTAAVCLALAHGCDKPLKVFLLDQTKIAGIGNIYASEALWLAKLPPLLNTQRLTRRHAGRLARAVRSVLDRALTRGGTSLRDFVNARGEAGDNRHYLRVYDRAGLRCPRRGCAGVIVRSVTQGRATFCCPRCQRI
jgi:formamidopyrimidine-DNA glycosylase